MVVTIGEISNELLKYSNYVNMMMFKNTPYTVAAISNKNGYTQAYMYIVQISENVYSACTDITDTGGARFYPTGNIEKPFIRELEQIHSLFSGSRELNDYHYTFINNASYAAMIEYIYDRLIQFRVVEPNATIVKKRVADLGFTSPKIPRVINKEFTRWGIKTGTIWDLTMCVNAWIGTFDISELKQKEIDVVINKLKGVGVCPQIESGYITDITFLKH